MIRALLVGLALLDGVLGITCLAAPEWVLGLWWPGAGSEARVMLQRTAWIWLGFALIQCWTAWQPTAERLRQVALLRGLDVLPDVWWVSMAGGLTPLGTVMIGSAPLANLALSLVFWRVSMRMV